MPNTININELRSGDNPTYKENPNIIVDPNVKKALDQSNQMHEISASDVGLPVITKKLEPDDIGKSLNLIDSFADKMQDEVKRFNEAIDENGGELSELEWRAKNNESARSVLVDGVSQEIAESGILPVVSQQPNTENAIAPEAKSIDDEIRELDEDEDVVCEPVYTTKQTTAPVIYEVKPEPVQEKIQPIMPAQRTDYTKEEFKELHYEYTEPISEVKEESTTSLNKEDTNSEDTIDADIDKLLNGYEDVAPVDDFEEKLKAEIKKKITGNSKIADISNFKIVTDRPVTVTNVINMRGSITSPTFKWPLINSNMVITMRSFNADEIDELSENSKNVHTTRSVFLKIYEHIVDGKGTDFESWCKNISRHDINHLWMAIYGACYQGSNYLPYSCADCKNVTLAEDTPIMDMVKFKDAKSKDKFNELMGMSTFNTDFGTIHCGALVPLGSTIAIQFREPSIYQSIIEPTNLDDDTRKTYSDIVDMMPYIDEIYIIEQGTQSLRPINVKIFPNNPAKTAKLKVLQWAKILRTLNSDEKGILAGNIATLSTKDDGVSYCLPRTTCEHCGKEIDEDVMGAADLVFTRHRLVLYGIL